MGKNPTGRGSTLTRGIAAAKRHRKNNHLPTHGSEISKRGRGQHNVKPLLQRKRGCVFRIHAQKLEEEEKIYKCSATWAFEKSTPK